MTNIKLNIPRFEQLKNTCGHSCLQEVLAYYRDKRSLGSILKEVKMIKGTGITVPQIAEYAVRQGYKTRLYLYSFANIDPTWKSLSKKQIVNKLKKRIKYVQKAGRKDYIGGYVRPWDELSCKSLLSFIKLGGELIITPITKELIISHLKKKMPVIVCLNSTAHFGEKREYDGKWDDIKGKCTGHFVVVAGYRDGKFYVINTDSKWRLAKEYYCNEDKLMNDVLSWNPSMIVVYKK